jgi:hypothetical protein
MRLGDNQGKSSFSVNSPPVSDQVGNLSTNQVKALSALVSYPTVMDAARACGLTDRTLRRYLEDPTFKEALRATRRQMVLQTIGALQSAGSEAVSTLRSVMTDSDATASAKVTAARIVLEQSLVGLEMNDLIERLSELEASMYGRV